MEKLKFSILFVASTSFKNCEVRLKNTSLVKLFCFLLHDPHLSNLITETWSTLKGICSMRLDKQKVLCAPDLKQSFWAFFVIQ